MKKSDILVVMHKVWAIWNWITVPLECVSAKLACRPDILRNSCNISALYSMTKETVLNGQKVLWFLFNYAWHR
jgi:hypothetical protein